MTASLPWARISSGGVFQYSLPAWVVKKQGLNLRNLLDYGRSLITEQMSIKLQGEMQAANSNRQEFFPRGPLPDGWKMIDSRSMIATV